MARYITEVVRLRSAPVTEFNRIIREIEEGRPFNAKLYEPMHKCIRDYHSSGNTHVFDSAISTLQAQADVALGRERIKPKSNLAVIETYRDQFAQPFRPVTDGTPGRFKSFRLDLNSLTIIGKPHLTVEGRGGKRKFLYLVTSKEWEEADVRFGANLLAEIVVANVPGSTHSDVEVLDCRRGRKITARPLSKRDLDALQQLGALLKDRGLN